MDNNTTHRPKMIGIVMQLLYMAALGNSVAGRQANTLLTNGFQAPIPRRMLNQRQKRKIAAQNR